MPFSLRQFRQDSQRCPHNAAFYGDGILIQVAEHQMECIRVHAVSELLVRHYFDRTEESLCRIKRWIPEIERFVDRCDAYMAQKGIRMETVFAALSVPPRLLAAIRLRFRPLLEADGLIPVYATDSAEEAGALLPFRLENTDGKNQVVDADGRPLQEWSRALSGLPNLALENEKLPGWRVTVFFHSAALPDGFVFGGVEGYSLQLPLQMALWRRSGLLPKYNPHHVVSSGMFNCRGELECVETEAKALRVANIRDGILVCPDNAPAFSTGDVRIPVPSGMSAENLLPRLREICEERHFRDAAYASRRLHEFDISLEIDIGRSGNWEQTATRLENLLKSTSSLDHPEEYLAYMMMLGMAYCHAGNTGDAMRVNQMAMEFAAERKEFLAYLARLQVQMLVMLQDEERFEELFLHAGEIEKKWDETSSCIPDEETRLDLCMRFRGSLGQAMLCGTLQCLSGCSPESARKNLQEAFDCAQKLWEMAEASQDEEKMRWRASDKAQDANYLHWWDAFFHPDNLPDSFEAAANIESNFNDEPRHKNRMYLLRQQALGEYRQVLASDGALQNAGGSCLQELLPEYDAMLDDVQASCWVRATVSKYLGSLWCQRGQPPNGLDAFHMADALSAGWTNGVFEKIRMTILAEAYRSLRDFPEHSAKAEEYRAKALVFFKCPEHATPANLRWKAFLEDSNAPFPGLEYWY